MFGGVSAEHDVSIISGLQVLENIDQNKYKTFTVKLGQDGLFHYYPGLKKRTDYLKSKSTLVTFGRDKSGTFFLEKAVWGGKKYLDVAFLAFHGGNGESGQIQGFLDTLGLPYTSPDTQTSVIAMNKALTKEVISLKTDIEVIPWLSISSTNAKNNPDEVIQKIEKVLHLPVIVKPVHLGSSIAINVAHTKIELKKSLLAASFVDSEILVEKFMEDFTELNISVRKVDGKIITSEIEHPISKDKILSFANKYSGGGKKTGGMANLARELPAKIPTELKTKIQTNATKAYLALRAKGLVRIDFMVKGGDIILIEVNPIPGSLSFFLWEASGTSFKDLITQEITEALKEKVVSDSYRIKYESDIVAKFCHHKPS